MKFKGTLILIVLCALLLVLVLVVDKGGSKSGDGAETKKLFKVEEGKIRRIALTRSGSAIVAVRGDKRWTIEQPVQAEGNKEEWNGLALALSAFDYERVVEEKPTDLARYGLDTPELVVTFEVEKGQVQKLELGAPNFSGGSYYARRGNDPKVYLVSGYARDKFTTDLDRLRESAAMKFDVYAATAFRLDRPDGSLKFVKKNWNWFLETPVAGPADDNEFETVLRQCSELRAADPLDGVEPARLKQAFGPVRYRVSVTLEQGEPHVLEIGAAAPFPANAGQVLALNVARNDYFTLPEAALGALDTPLEKLRSHDLARFYPFEVKGVTWESGGARTILAKAKDGGWTWKRKEGDTPLDGARVDEFLGRLRDLKVTAFLDAPDPARLGLAQPAARIILDVESKAGVTLLFGPAADGQRTARNSEYAFAVRFDEAAWRDLKFEPAAWRPASEQKK
jgi:hypothetical protein